MRADAVCGAVTVCKADASCKNRCNWAEAVAPSAPAGPESPLKAVGQPPGPRRLPERKDSQFPLSVAPSARFVLRALEDERVHRWREKAPLRQADGIGLKKEIGHPRFQSRRPIQKLFRRHPQSSEKCLAGLESLGGRPDRSMGGKNLHGTRQTKRSPEKEWGGCFSRSGRPRT